MHRLYVSVKPYEKFMQLLYLDVHVKEMKNISESSYTRIKQPSLTSIKTGIW